MGDDDGVRPEGALCEAALTLSGTFAPEAGTPAPAEQGCVPHGTWTVQVTVTDEGDCADVAVGTTYEYVIAGDGRDRTITYGGTEDTTLGLSAGGGGECEGSFEHISAAADGVHVVLLKPYTEPGTTAILGTGTYQLWEEAP